MVRYNHWVESRSTSSFWPVYAPNSVNDRFSKPHRLSGLSARLSYHSPISPKKGCCRGHPASVLHHKYDAIKSFVPSSRLIRIISSSQIHLVGSHLVALCEKDDGRFAFSQLDLNDYLGNVNGSFDTESVLFYSSAQEIGLDGATLLSTFRTTSNTLSKASLNLNIYVANINGQLVFQKPAENIADSCSCFIIEGSILKALCLGRDGRFYQSQIDLEQLFIIREGRFEIGKGGWFRTARNVRLDITAGIYLHAEVQVAGGKYVETFVDLSSVIVNRHGVLVFEENYSSISASALRSRVRHPFSFGGSSKSPGSLTLPPTPGGKESTSSESETSSWLLLSGIGATFGGILAAACAGSVSTGHGTSTSTTVSSGSVAYGSAQWQSSVTEHVNTIIHQNVASNSISYFTEWTQKTNISIHTVVTQTISTTTGWVKGAIKGSANAALTGIKGVGLGVAAVGVVGVAGAALLGGAAVSAGQHVSQSVVGHVQGAAGVAAGVAQGAYQSATGIASGTVGVVSGSSEKITESVQNVTETVHGYRQDSVSSSIHGRVDSFKDHGHGLLSKVTGAASSVSGAISSGVSGGISGGIAGGVTGGVAGGAAGGVAAGATSGAAAAGASHGISSITSGALGGIASGVAGGLASGAIGGIAGGLVGGLADKWSFGGKKTPTSPGPTQPFPAPAVVTPVSVHGGPAPVPIPVPQPVAPLIISPVEPLPHGPVVVPAPTHYSVSLTPGAYVIRNGRTKGSLHVSGATVVHWEYTGEIHQKWILESGVNGYKIKHAVSGLYLSFTVGVEITASTEVILSAHAAEWQIFRETESYTIVLASNTRYVLDLYDANVVNGTKIIVNPKTGNPNQVWSLESVVFDLPQKLYSGALELGTYYIRNSYSKAALDLDHGKDTPGSPIYNWDVNGGDNQKWILEAGYYGYKIKNVASQTYLSFAPGVLAVSGSAVTGNPVPAEWMVERHGNSYIFVLASNVSLALDLFQSETSNGTKIILYQKTGQPNQDWSVERIEVFVTHSRGPALYKGDVDPGTYLIRNAYSKGCIDLKDGNRDNGAPVGNWTYNGHFNQRWVLEAGFNGYRIKNYESGTYLAFGTCASVSTGTAVSGSDDALEWKVERHGKNFIIALADNPRLVLDLSGWHTGDGAEIVLWGKNGGENQDWIFEVLAPSTPAASQPQTPFSTISGPSSSSGYVGALPPGDYTIKNVSSKDGLDLSGGLTAPGTPIINYSFHGGKNQTWTFEPGYQGYKIKNGFGTYIGFASGVRVVAGAAISGNPVGVEWQIQRHGNNYLIVLASDPSLTLDLFESNGNNGTKIIAYPKTGNPNQDWIIEPKSEPVKASYTGPFPTGVPFKIRNAYSKKALDLLNSNPAPGTQIANWVVNGGKNQSWILEAGEHGYRIRNGAHNNSYLGFAQGVSPTTRGSIISGNPTPVEWTITRENNLVLVHLASDPRLVLDLSDYNTKDGAKVVVWDKNGGENQGWIFEATA